MITEEFNSTIDSWIEQLDYYGFPQLRAKPSESAWSLGQVYMHLIESTAHFFEEARRCLSSNDHEHEEASPSAKKMFDNNELPDILIEGPASNRNTPQPDSKDQLIDGLMKLKAELNSLGALMSATEFRGKTKHPGLRYFGAHDWLLFAEMHFRHHLRQKRRIDDFLSASADRS
ncbi:MAG TPA: DinB family protein [Chryseosolibacter sp.]